ncbi:MAG: hypothetical protein K0R40_2601 [Burkholderiales bacterium]|nr:hypothetical protein [Burkholderiales bacterium]
MVSVLKRLLPVAILAALAALASGCSTVRFAYENADAYVRWTADGYLDVHGEDADWLDDRIREFHGWHRVNELPKYARLAQEASRRFADGLSREDVVWGYDAARAQARESLRKAAELVSPLLDRLSAEQVAHLEGRIAEENRKFHRDNLRGSESGRRAKRAKSIENRLEDWVGRLSKAQVERVRVFAERAPLLDELRDRDRKRLQADVMAIIRARQARQHLAERVVHYERGREPAYAAGLQQWREQAFALLVDLDATLSPEQRARAAGNLRRYAEDFEALSSR